jgi:hypothetical protein
MIGMKMREYKIRMRPVNETDYEWTLVRQGQVVKQVTEPLITGLEKMQTGMLEDLDKDPLYS